MKNVLYYKRALIERLFLYTKKLLAVKTRQLLLTVSIGRNSRIHMWGVLSIREFFQHLDF